MAMVYERHTYPREHLQWTFKAVASKISEYHLIDLATGVSHGGFEALSGARQFAHEKRLPAWDIFHGNLGRVPRSAQDQPGRLTLRPAEAVDHLGRPVTCSPRVGPANDVMNNVRDFVSLRAAIITEPNAMVARGGS